MLASSATVLELKGWFSLPAAVPVEAFFAAGLAADAFGSASASVLLVRDIGELTELAG